MKIFGLPPLLLIALMVPIVIVFAAVALPAQ
jgi:hypothetical protein